MEIPRLIEISPQEQREFLKGLLVASDQFFSLPSALRGLFDDLESADRNILHFIADQLGRDGAKRIFFTFLLAYPDVLLEALNDDAVGSPRTSEPHSADERFLSACLLVAKRHSSSGCVSDAAAMLPGFPDASAEARDLGRSMLSGKTNPQS